MREDVGDGVGADDDLQLDAPLVETYPSSAGSDCRFPSCARAVICGSGEATAAATRLMIAIADFMAMRLFL
jgi:hypothetical protein